MSQYTPVQDGDSLGAAGSRTFDFSGVAFMGAATFINWGPGEIALNFTDTPPGAVSRGAGRNVLAANAVLTVPVTNITHISVLADGSGADIDVLVVPIQQAGS